MIDIVLLCLALATVLYLSWGKRWAKSSVPEDAPLIALEAYEATATTSRKPKYNNEPYIPIYAMAGGDPPKGRNGLFMSDIERYSVSVLSTLMPGPVGIVRIVRIDTKRLPFVLDLDKLGFTGLSLTQAHYCLPTNRCADVAEKNQAGRWHSCCMSANWHAIENLEETRELLTIRLDPIPCLVCANTPVLDLVVCFVVETPADAEVRGLQ